MDDAPHPSEPEEIILEETETKRVNVKSMTVRNFQGTPYYRFEAVNGKKGYAYDLNKGMYPTLGEMMDALVADRAAVRAELEALENGEE